MSGIKADFSGALAKTAALKATPRAVKLQMTRWATETNVALRRSAAGMQKGHSMGHLKSGDLARAIGQKIESTERGWRVSVGTGFGTKQIKYARIQDEGGKVTAKNASFTIQNIAGKPHLGPYLTVPLRGVKGRVSNYPGAFVIRSKKGNLLVVQPLTFSGGKRKGERKLGKQAGIKPLFVLKYSVDIPPSRWFSAVIDAREPVLREYMDPAVLYNIASQMTGGGG